LDAFEPRVRERVAEWVYGTETDSFPSVVGGLLRGQGLSLAVAESATGGQLASLITEAPGASDYFTAGYVVYFTPRKSARVSPTVLDEHGTIAQVTTQALASAARERAAADVAVGDEQAWLDRIIAEGKTGGPSVHRGRRAGRQTCYETRYSTTRTEYKRRGALEALYHLWRSFVSSSAEEWRATTLKKALERAPERDDLFETTSHIPLQPAYTSEDLRDWDERERLAYPGEYPYTRGTQATMYRGRLWTMRQYAGYASAEDRTPPIVICSNAARPACQ